MKPWVCKAGVVFGGLLLAACGRNIAPVAHAADTPPGAVPGPKRETRLTGIVQAVHASKVLVPQIWGQGGPMTLTHLIPNGSHVKDGDLIAVFDSVTQSDNARDAK